MDTYDGLPTEAQLRQVDWSWEDATTDAAAINKILAEAMPAVYAALGTPLVWPRIAPVQPLVR